MFSTTGPALLGWGSRDGGVQCVGGEEEGDAGFASPSTTAELASLLSVTVEDRKEKSQTMAKVVINCS